MYVYHQICMPVVTDNSPGGAVGNVVGKICGGSAENINVQLNYATGSYQYELIEIKCIKTD